MSLSLFSTEVLSTWLISLDSNLQKESSLSQLEYVSVSIDDNIRIKPQKVRKRKKINKITRIPEIYRKPFWLYKERLLALHLQTGQIPYIQKFWVRQRTEIFPIVRGFSVTLRGAQMWEFLNTFALLQMPKASRARVLLPTAQESRNIVMKFRDLELIQYPRNFPLSFRREYDVRLLFQFNRACCYNAAVTTGLQFYSSNFRAEAQDGFTI